MKTTYTTFGTCSHFIDIELDGDLVKEVRFVGGCAGNTRGIAALAAGMPVSMVIEKTRGIVCRNDTSCPDQLARALESLSLQQAS
jgi:uncharacterized protein (TIGR03905 family)